MSHGLGFFAAFQLWVAPSAVVRLCQGPSAVVYLWVGCVGSGLLMAQLLCGGVVVAGSDLHLLFCGWF